MKLETILLRRNLMFGPVYNADRITPRCSLRRNYIDEGSSTEAQTSHTKNIHRAPKTVLVLRC